MEIWQTIIQLILLPTSIVAVLAFVMREFFKSYLSKDIEKYKSQLQSDLESFKIELQSNLESHKARLKAEFDAKHFEFQTKYSLLHQQRADVIQHIYAKINWIERELLIIKAKIKYSDNENLSDEVLSRIKILSEKKVELASYFSERRILVDETNCKIIDDIIASIFYCSNRISTTNPIESEELIKELVDKFPKAKKNLEIKFRQLLSPELLNYQLEEKQ